MKDTKDLDEFSWKELDELIKKKKDEVNYFVELGDQSLKLKDFDEALENYEKALEIDRNNPNLLEKIGDILVKVKSLKKAMDYYSEASRIVPQNDILKKKWEYVRNQTTETSQTALKTDTTIPFWIKKSDSTTSHLPKIEPIVQTHVEINNEIPIMRCSMCGDPLPEKYNEIISPTSRKYVTVYCISCQKKIKEMANQPERYPRTSFQEFCNICWIVRIIIAIIIMIIAFGLFFEP